MTTKLSIARGCFRILDSRAPTQNELDTGANEAARLFNEVWDDGGLDACLRAGEWRFARRSVRLDASPSIEPEFGLRYAFDKPEDFVRICGMWRNEMMTEPLMDYREEAGYWFASQDTLYLTYISNDEQYGGDYSLWPNDFLKFVQAHFASEIAGPLTEKGSEALGLRKRYLDLALPTDGTADPTRRLPSGSWVQARVSGRHRRDGQPR